MTVSIHDKRALRDAPFRGEAERRLTRLMEERATMPKTIDGLCEWYAREAWYAMPEALHKAQVWRDHVLPSELEQGLSPVGASESGALAYADEFRRLIENSPSEVDEDGFYRRPIGAALSRLSRKQAPKGGPLMAFRLLGLANSGFDWRRHADHLGRTHEEHHTYMFQALIALWLEFREAKRD